MIHGMEYAQGWQELRTRPVAFNQTTLFYAGVVYKANDARFTSLVQYCLSAPPILGAVMQSFDVKQQ